MKRRILGFVTASALALSLIGCSSADVQLSAINRDLSTQDDVVWFDDEAVALAAAVTESTDESAKLQKNMERDILDLVNAERKAKGLSALKWDDSLAACAKVRAKECQQSFSHTRPNGKAWYTVNSEIMWGENLAKGYESAKEVVEAWMASPTHAENILGAEFKTCSISIYEVNGKLYFAQEFGL